MTFNNYFFNLVIKCQYDVIEKIFENVDFDR